MIIEKVLNNNLLLTHNTKGKEVIVMGKGISFQKVQVMRSMNTRSIKSSI